MTRLQLFTALVGIALSLVAYVSGRNSETRTLQSEFQRLTEQSVTALNTALEINLDALAHIRGLFLASRGITRSDFHSFTLPILERHHGIQALEWIPRTERSQRAEFERSVQADGFADFRIVERSPDGSMAPAGDRAVYYPVRYLEPLTGNMVALGFDLASDPRRLETLEAARDRAQTLATPSVTLVQEQQRQKGVLVIVPLYAGNPTDVESRRAALRGFILGVYRIGDLVDNAMNNLHGEWSGLSFELFDAQLPGEEGLLYRFNAVDEAPQGTWRELRTDIPVAGRTWSLVSRPTLQFIEHYQSMLPETLAGGGILLSLILAAYIRRTQDQHMRIGQLVAQRTHDLQVSEGRTRAILETAVNGIVTIDAQGVVQMFNPGAEKMFGYQAREVVGKNVNMLMPEPYHSAHDGYLARYLAERTPKIIGIGREVTGRRRDGSTFPLQLSVGEARLDDESLFVGILTDITLYKEAESALLTAKEEAIRNSRMKSEFLNMMSHELRTPLTVILGYLPLLRDQKRQLPPPLLAQIAGDMQTSGDHLLEIINELLDISKIEAGKMELNCRALPARDVVAEVVERMRIKADEQGIALMAEVTDDVLWADPLRLRQILYNLVGNALKFTEQGEVRVSARAEDGRMVFSVSDTGCGIEEDQLELIFEKFSQVDSSSTRAARGTGLGLPITRRLVELHSGEIRVRSSPGSGSTFTFTIPLAAERH